MTSKKVSLDLLSGRNVKWKKIHETLTERKSDGKIGNSLSEKEVLFCLQQTFCGGSVFCSIGNCVPYGTKTLRGMHTRAKWKFAAEATALGARVPQAELFVICGR